MDISAKNFKLLQIDQLTQQLQAINQASFKPPSKLNIYDFSKKHLYLGSDFANPPGPYSSSRNNWQEEILRTISTHTRTVLMIGSQMGKSVIQLCVCIYYVSQKPCPIMYVVNSDKQCKNFSVGRFSPVIKSSGLNHLFKREEDGSNTALYKKFNNGQIWFNSAGSANNLTAITAKVILLDEIDKWETLPNGDPVALAEQRAHVYGDEAKFIYTSTPLIKGESRIEDKYDDSDQRIYQHRCFHCDELFTPEWSMVKWESICEIPQPNTALLHCPHCGVGHTDHERNNAIKKGKWLVQNPGHPIAGFHTNVMSSHVALSQAVTKFLLAINDEPKMRQFHNETLGLPYEGHGERIDDMEFSDRLESYSKTELPNDVLFLTAGVDVQQGRLEVLVVGWGKDYESWIVDYFQILGAPDDVQTWHSLHHEIQQPYTRQDGQQVKLLKVGIDTGGNTAEIGGFSEYVRDFCKKFHQYGYLPFKGASSAQKTIFPTNKRKNGVVYLIDTAQAKELLFGWLKKPKQIHFYDALDAEFFNQLTSEERVSEKKNGRVKNYWRRIGTKRAEVLDTFVFSIGCRFSLPSNVEQMYINRFAKNKPLIIEPIQSEPDYVLGLQGVKPEQPKQSPRPNINPNAEPIEKKPNKYSRLFSK